MAAFETERLNVGPGWQDLITQLHLKLSEVDPDYKIIQIKEKFGGLRYYCEFSGGLTFEQFEYAQAAVRKTEQESEETCEECGARGRTSRWGGNWYRTLCKEHGERVTTS